MWGWCQMDGNKKSNEPFLKQFMLPSIPRIDRLICPVLLVTMYMYKNIEVFCCFFCDLYL